SVLNFLQDDLRERHEPPWVVVTFNAWQHQRLAPPWWWITAPLARQYDSFSGAFAEPGRPLGYLFLEKTFQMTLAIPALNEETRDSYWRRLIRPTDVEDRTALEAARTEAAGIFSGLTTEEDVRDVLAANPGSTPVQQKARIEAGAMQLATPRDELA